MNKQKVLTKALNNYGSYFDKFRQFDPEKEKRKIEKEELEKTKLERENAMRSYTLNCIKGIKEKCEKILKDGNQQNYISGFITMAGKFTDQLPCGSANEIQKSGYRERGNWVYPKFSLEPNTRDFCHSYPYKNYALPYNDNKFVDELVNNLNQEIGNLGPSSFQITPIKLDNVTIERIPRNTFFNHNNCYADFKEISNGECTVLKFDISW